jgi:hypothetical protein
MAAPGKDPKPSEKIYNNVRIVDLKVFKGN